MSKDLRTFLARVEKNAPEELLRVRRPVSSELEFPRCRGGRRQRAVTPLSSSRTSRTAGSR